MQIADMKVWAHCAAPVLYNSPKGLTLSSMTWGVPPPAPVAQLVTNVHNLVSPFLADQPKVTCYEDRNVPTADTNHRHICADEA
jgi:hypothetical protein